MIHPHKEENFEEQNETLTIFRYPDKLPTITSKKMYAGTHMFTIIIIIPVESTKTH